MAKQPKIETGIFKEVANAVESYYKDIEIIDGLMFNQAKTIRMIEFYSNSKYLNGQKDELDRIKPFMNIVNGVCDVENAAKDIDTKDFSITSDSGANYILAFLASKDIYEWMKEANFGKTLNDMRDTHTRYGSLLVKKCIYKDKGEKRTLKIEVPEWKNTITNQNNIAEGLIIEIHFMPAWKIMSKTAWKKTRQVVSKAMKQGYGKDIRVCEVSGYMPKAVYKEVAGEEITDKDQYTYSYQKYFLASGTEDEIVQGKLAGELTPMYWEDDAEVDYKYLARKRKSGRDFGVGVVEEGEEAQVQTNDAVLKQSRAMEYTSKVVGQSSSKKLKGRNLFNETVDGEILEVEPNGGDIKPLVLLPSGGLTQYTTLINQWYTQFQRATSAFDSQRGEQQGDVTFRGQALSAQQSGSVFQDLQEEMGVFYTEIMNDWVMPFLATELNNEHILAHDFTVEELKWMDENYAINQSNMILKEKILNGEIVTPQMQEDLINEHKDKIKRTQSSRFVKILKDEYKKLKTKVTVNITGEQKNRATTLESLNNIITLLQANPNATRDPFLMQLTSKIIELSGAGISPVALLSSIQESAKLQQESPISGEATKAIPFSLGAKAKDAITA